MRRLRMIEIINYVDIKPEYNKEDIIEEFTELLGWGTPERIKEELERLQGERNTKYLFIFQDGIMIGYMLIFGEDTSISKLFPYWALTNADEVPLEPSIKVLEMATEACREFGYNALIERFELLIRNYKKEQQQLQSKDNLILFNTYKA